MTVIQFLRLWESYHQSLTVAQQQKLVNHTSLFEILKYGDQEVMQFLPENPKLTQLLEKLQGKRMIGVEVVSGSDAGQTLDEYEPPCVHGELSRARCIICGQTPNTVRCTVYITSGGYHYHFKQNCSALENGQSLVDERGGARSRVRPVYEDIIKYDRNPCSVCKN